MIVFGKRKNENVGKNLFQGDLKECKAYCKKLIPAEFEDLNIDEENGTIVKRIILRGAFGEDFRELLEA